MLKEIRAQFDIDELARCKFIIGGLIYGPQMNKTLSTIKALQLSAYMVHEVTVSPLSYNMFPQLYQVPTQSTGTVRSGTLNNRVGICVAELERRHRRSFLNIVKKFSKHRYSTPYPVNDVPSRMFLPHFLLYPELGQHWFLRVNRFFEQSLEPSLVSTTKGVILCYPLLYEDHRDYNGLSLESGLDINMGSNTSLVISQELSGVQYTLHTPLQSIRGTLKMNYSRAEISARMTKLGFKLYRRQPTFDLWTKR